MKRERKMLTERKTDTHFILKVPYWFIFTDRRWKSAVWCLVPCSSMKEEELIYDNSEEK